MKKVMVFGTFDILHKGHLNFFKQAKKHGDYLIAVVAKDKTVKKVKKKNPKNSEMFRLLNVALAKDVNTAVLGYLDDPYKIIQENKPKVICLGYDQDSFTERLEEELKKRRLKIKIITLKPYKEHIYKSSKIKDFQDKVLSLCKKIPKGKITTYKEIGKTMKNKGYRAVGMALNKNKTPIAIPCHRVVNSDGSLGGYSKGIKKKISLLKKEGIKVKNKKIVNFKEKLFKF